MPLDENNVITLLHYKDPLKSVPQDQGFGFYGALSGTLDGEYLQCHECGKLFRNLGMHINNSHMKVDVYKEKWDLARQTALVAENERFRLKQLMVDYIKNLSDEEREEHKRKQREGRARYNARVKSEGNWKIRLETKNERGTCPDQLKEKVREVAEKLGRVPSRNEFIVECGSSRFMHLIQTTFGSWTNCLHQIGMEARTTNYGAGIKRKRYTGNELLQCLKDFYEVHGRIPTETDCRRKLIPKSQHYVNAFGSIVTARKLAGIE